MNTLTGEVKYTPKAGYTGRDRFAYHATSSNGTAATRTVAITITPRPVAPRLRALRIRPSELFAAAGNGGSITASPKPSDAENKHKAKQSGANVSYTDTESATTAFSVLLALRGARTTHGCVAPPHSRTAHIKARACVRFVTIGEFSHRDSAGANSFHFTARVKRPRAQARQIPAPRRPDLRRQTRRVNDGRVHDHQLRGISLPAAPSATQRSRMMGAPRERLALAHHD